MWLFGVVWNFTYRERGGGGEERQRDRQADSQTDGQRGRETGRKRQADRQMGWYKKK